MKDELREVARVLRREHPFCAAARAVRERLRRDGPVVEPPGELQADVVARVVGDRRVDVRDEHGDECRAADDIRAFREEELVVAVRLLRRDGVCLQLVGARHALVVERVLALALGDGAVDSGLASGLGVAEEPLVTAEGVAEEELCRRLVVGDEDRQNALATVYRHGDDVAGAVGKAALVVLLQLWQRRSPVAHIVVLCLILLRPLVHADGERTARLGSNDVVRVARAALALGEDVGQRYLHRVAARYAQCGGIGEEALGDEHVGRHADAHGGGDDIEPVRQRLLVVVGIVDAEEVRMADGLQLLLDERPQVVEVCHLVFGCRQRHLDERGGASVDAQRHVLRCLHLQHLRQGVGEIYLVQVLQYYHGRKGNTYIIIGKRHKGSSLSGASLWAQACTFALRVRRFFGLGSGARALPTDFSSAICCATTCTSTFWAAFSLAISIWRRASPLSEMFSPVRFFSRKA